jgi:membrane fusion protein (multidrug efflux system)
VLAGTLVALLPQLGLCAQPAVAPPAVTVAPVVVKDVAPVYSYIGHVIAIQSVQIVPRVTAFVDSIPVKQGSDVKAGQVLIQLQKAQYEAALKSAQAQLASAQAGLWQAQIAYEQADKLYKPKQNLVETQSAYDQAVATRDQDQASVLAAQANVAQAGLNLSYCTISSPIDGRIGAITLTSSSNGQTSTIALTKGELVTPSTPAVATINQLDPIRVVFSVTYGDIVRATQTTEKTPNQIAAGLVVNLTLPDGAAYKQSGKIAFLSTQVDQATGTVAVYADFPNPERLLLPDAYVTVGVRRAKPEEKPLVPVAAVQTDRSGNYVLVVGPDKKVQQQPVTLGRQISQDFIVEKGVSGGERVIVAGVQKVRPGEIVNPVAAPAASVASVGVPSQTDPGG